MLVFISGRLRGYPLEGPASGAAASVQGRGRDMDDSDEILQPGLIALCKGNSDILAVLKAAGITSLGEVEELTEKDVRALGLEDLVVQRRLIDRGAADVHSHLIAKHVLCGCGFSFAPRISSLRMLAAAAHSGLGTLFPNSCRYVQRTSRVRARQSGGVPRTKISVSFAGETPKSCSFWQSTESCHFKTWRNWKRSMCGRLAARTLWCNVDSSVEVRGTACFPGGRD